MLSHMEAGGWFWSSNISSPRPRPLYSLSWFPSYCNVSNSRDRSQSRGATLKFLNINLFIELCGADVIVAQNHKQWNNCCCAGRTEHHIHVIEKAQIGVQTGLKWFKQIWSYNVLLDTVRGINKRVLQLIQGIQLVLLVYVYNIIKDISDDCEINFKCLLSFPYYPLGCWHLCRPNK